MSIFADDRLARAALLTCVLLTPGKAPAQAPAAVRPGDLGGVLVSLFVPTSVPAIGTRAQSLLYVRLGQVASSGGLLGIGARSRFVLLPMVTVLESTKTEGVQKMTVVSAEVAFIVQDLTSHSTVHQYVARVGGSGVDESAAISQAISSIRIDAPALVAFAQQVRERIVNYYETHCSAIVQEARAGVARGNPEVALAALFSVPVASATCHPRAMKEVAGATMLAEKRQQSAAPKRQDVRTASTGGQGGTTTSQQVGGSAAGQSAAADSDARGRAIVTAYLNKPESQMSNADVGGGR